MNVTPEFNHFLLWEKSTHDTIDFKKIYVDMTGDILAGLMLSEIVYWHLPSRDGDPKMRVSREGHLWIACARAEWWDRTRMSPRQADRAMKTLEALRLIERRAFLFNRQRVTHIRLDQDVFVQLWNALIADPAVNPYNGVSLSGNGLVTSSLSGNQTVTPHVTDSLYHVTKPARPITETTTESTDKSLFDEALTPSSDRAAHTPQATASKKKKAPTNAEQSASPRVPRAPSPRKPPPHQPHFIELVKANGLDVETMLHARKSAANYWSVAAELRAINFPVDEIAPLYDYVKAKARHENWHSLTVNAVGKYAPDYLRDRGNLHNGNGNHTAPPPLPPPERLSADEIQRRLAVKSSILGGDA